MTLKGFKLTFSTVALEGGRVVFFFFSPGNLGGSGCWGLRAGGGKVVVGAGREMGSKRKTGECVSREGKSRGWSFRESGEMSRRKIRGSQ